MLALVAVLGGDLPRAPPRAAGRCRWRRCCSGGRGRAARGVVLAAGGGAGYRQPARDAPPWRDRRAGGAGRGDRPARRLAASVSSTTRRSAAAHLAERLGAAAVSMALAVAVAVLWAHGWRAPRCGRSLATVAPVTAAAAVAYAFTGRVAAAWLSRVASSSPLPLSPSERLAYDDHDADFPTFAHVTPELRERSWRRGCDGSIASCGVDKGGLGHDAVPAPRRLIRWTLAGIAGASGNPGVAGAPATGGRRRRASRARRRGSGVAGTGGSAGARAAGTGGNAAGAAGTSGDAGHGRRGWSRRWRGAGGTGGAGRGRQRRRRRAASARRARAAAAAGTGGGSRGRHGRRRPAWRARAARGIGGRRAAAAARRRWSRRQRRQLHAVELL